MPDRRTGDVRKRQAGAGHVKTCVGTPGRLTTWTYGAHGSIVSDATGQCLYTSGSHGPGHRVELRDCTGKADRRWTAPRN
ncbi:ricin-type beta-trefoil lectin domain protein [Streptomyces sp. NPDC057909]|uniref:ricin-type beta-trefoil lectin domain protein n=1 Tax=Streptomyces sp. NPDC057909 TaxID=3346277 RepID=UPI0036E99C11